MLNVLQLIPTLDRSGAEKQMVLLARHLPREKFHVEVAALTRLGPFEEDLKAAGVPITLFSKRHKLDPVVLGRLVRFLKKHQFHIVHTWLFAGNTYGRFAAFRAGVPVVIAAEMAVDLWKSPRHLAIDRWLARWTDRVVGNSDAVIDFYRQAGVPPDRLEMIYSGVELEEPQVVDPALVRSEFGWPAESPVVLFAGRLAAQKRVDDLLCALDLLQHIRPDVRTLIVGEGPLRGRLEQMARDFCLGESVRFLGHRDDVLRLLGAADVLVLPSLYEGLPNVVLEAMWARKPVVATAAPGTTEAVVDGETGLLVPTQAPPALAEAIRKVVDCRQLAWQMGQAGHARVAARFGAPAMVQRFAELYDRLAHAKGLALA